MTHPFALALQLTLKRGFDLAVASLLLTLTFPLMALIALGVKASSPGDCIFRQTRSGRGGHPFTLLKFRSMSTEEDAPPAPGSTRASQAARRVTPFGKALRATSLDELPQLLNILRGEMSFVGPRPDLPHHVARYSDFQRQRLQMRPGLTGWAQVNGRNQIPWEDRIRLDVEYVQHWSLWLDAIVLLKTIGVVLTGKNIAPAGN